MEINLARTIESKYTAFNNKFLVLVVFPIGKRKASVCTEVCTWMTIAELLVQAKNASKFLFYWEAERWGKHGCPLNCSPDSIPIRPNAYSTASLWSPHPSMPTLDTCTIYTLSFKILLHDLLSQE